VDILCIRMFLAKMKDSNCTNSNTFKLEADLVTILIDKIDNLVKNTTAVFTKQEWYIGRRIADIAICGFNSTPLPNSLPKSIKRLNYYDVHIIAHLFNRPLRLLTISERVKSSTIKVQKSLGKLKRSELVDQTSAGAYHLTDWRCFIPSKIITIEAKLQDWKTAIQQASYHKKFSDFSYIAMPSKKCTNENLTDSCKELGIGLISVFNKSKSTLSIKAKRNCASNSPQRDIAAMSLLQAFMKEACHATAV